MRQKLNTSVDGQETGERRTGPINGRHKGLEELINQDDSLLDAVLENLSKRFWFVGLQEEMTGSVQCFQKLLANATHTVLAARAALNNEVTPMLNIVV